ncbi:MAG TPA: TetR/AcrR family transcriptional regulator [Polyangiaceae bacterium]|nr:TetR/AcrR family transcriptional regulator [Polyangiaceae bacterium]
MRLETASEKKLGRPRDERARRSVLDAVREQLKHGSLCGMTMEGIARQAGVGKQTIYRWWPSVAEVALEALIEEAGEQCPLPETGSMRGDLKAFLSGTFLVVTQRTGSLLRCLMVEAQKNPEFRTRFREQFIRSRQEALTTLLRRYDSRPTDTYPIVDIVYGSLWYRLLVGHQPLDDALAEQLADVVVALLQSQQ